MKKLKEILQGIAFLFVGIPIMIMASIMDQRAFKKEREQWQKAQEQNK
jgi:bifunctional DNase/RNase